MKQLDFYDKIGCHNQDEVFKYFLKNLKPNLFTWDYFVNWEKVIRNTDNIEIHLNTLNYLIGKDDFDNEFRRLLSENPKVIKAIPSLVVRGSGDWSRLKILSVDPKKGLEYQLFDFNKEELSNEDIESYLEFVDETGLKGILTDKRIKSLVDYVFGVEAGLDSNARKNRTGHSMENILEKLIGAICAKNNFSYLKEANSAKIKMEYGYDVPMDKSSRRYDFVVNTGEELVIFETNFYSGGGSKLKATAGEYKGLDDVLYGKFKFVWVTDGSGWNTCQLPLKEAFIHNNYIVSLDMIEKGILDEILLKLQT